MYDASLLESGSQGTSGSGGGAGTSGTSGAPSAGLGDIDSAGDGSVSGSAGAGGSIGDGGTAESGGAPSSGNAGTSGGGTGGAGGTAASGGAIAGAGAGGAGAGGATAGAGGSLAGAGGSMAGAGGQTQVANGCAKLSVPLNDTGDKAHFVVTLNSVTDLSNATVSMRLYVQAGQGGTIFNYVQDQGSFHFMGVPAAQRQKLSSLSGWSTLTWNVGTEPDAGTGIAKNNIRNIGIEVNAQPSTTWSNPTVIYVDSITVSSPALSFTFDSSGSVSPTPATASPGGQALWLNSGSSDTSAAGTSVSWQATCP